MTTEHPEPIYSNAEHAIALHTGFAGSRALCPDLELAIKQRSADIDVEQRAGDPELEKLNALAETRFQLIVNRLTQSLQELPGRLGLHSGYFLVGLSQMAIGADSAFADACRRLGFLHRVLLPQPRDGFLEAEGSAGPDFTPLQRKDAEKRLEAANVIQERVVSVSANRRTRFQETSFEILRLAEVVISLQPRVSGVGKPGGTQEFLEAARRHGKPALICEFDFDDAGKLQWTDNSQELAQSKEKWPRLPAQFSTALPRAGFISKLKKAASDEADRLKIRFDRRMKRVIGAHVGATALASAALALSYAIPGKSTELLIAVAILLVLELILLAWGWWTHQCLHHDRDTHEWAVTRLAAEIARSAQTLGPGIDRIKVGEQIIEQQFAGQHTYLKVLFDLPMPEEFRALTRTLNVLHLDATTGNKHADWRDLRERYVRERLETTLTKNRGQIPYFESELAKADHAVKLAHGWFNAAVATAFFATTVKLLLPLLAIKLTPFAAALSWLAIVMPVFAVAAMSLTANLDKEARKSTYKDVLDFLRAQRERLRAAETEPEFFRLQAECEAKLLSETINWYYRRRFMNPA
ncbi:MAG: hypothetical protein MUE46_04890 [Xanthomonadales bacterium]|jgi:hypothetical protein|nr:hypothetical protein [Xanthomonadales bacterium]